MVEQRGAERAAYGAALIENLAQRLTATFGKGYGRQNLRYMRSFYLAFPTGSALPEIRQTTSGELAEKHQKPSGESKPPKFSPALSWTHYLILSRVTNPKARAFYEIEAARERWVTQALERQIAALLYERLSNQRPA
ncbi:MAG TPA: DUF1016 N-terminal domain-containing protein, partial [Kofleriaceae bacterium]|nr:DUF1016 N-terminal domain-containing protein [Kofleriaceae bacterium]